MRATLCTCWAKITWPSFLQGVLGPLVTFILSHHLQEDEPPVIGRQPYVLLPPHLAAMCFHGVYKEYVGLCACGLHARHHSDLWDEEFTEERMV